MPKTPKTKETQESERVFYPSTQTSGESPQNAEGMVKQETTQLKEIDVTPEQRVTWVNLNKLQLNQSIILKVDRFQEIRTRFGRRHVLFGYDVNDSTYYGCFLGTDLIRKMSQIWGVTVRQGDIVKIQKVDVRNRMNIFKIYLLK